MTSPVGLSAQAREWLAGLCFVPSSVDEDGRVDCRLRTWFQRFLSVKLLCMFHLLWKWDDSGGGWLHIAAAAATLGMNVRRTARSGTIAWLALTMVLVVRSWPYTLNHLLLEAVVLGLLALFPACLQPLLSEQGDKREASDDLQLLWLTMLSVWFFAGVQKVVHGYYLSGESIALSLLTDNSGSGPALRFGLSALGAVMGAPSEAGASVALPVSLGLQQVALGTLGRVYCVALGVLIAVAEIALPLLTFFRATRHAATVGLAVAQCCVGLLTNELDFALFGLALIGLGSGRLIAPRYLLLAALSIADAFGPTLGWWGT